MYGNYRMAQNQNEVHMKNQITAINEQKLSLARTRDIANSLIIRLQKAEKKPDADKEYLEDKHIWGDKENKVSALTHITALLIKIIAAERELFEYEQQLKSSITPCKERKKPLDEEDKKTIRRYIKRIQEGGEGALEV